MFTVLHFYYTLTNSHPLPLFNRLIDKYDHFDEELKRLDPLLHTNIIENIKKDMNYEENLRKIERKLTIKSVRDLGPVSGNNNGINTYEKAVEMWVKQTMNGSNITSSTNDSNSSINKIENPFGINIYTSTDINGDGNGTNPFALGLMPNMIRFPAALPALLLPIIFRYVCMCMCILVHV